MTTYALYVNSKWWRMKPGIGACPLSDGAGETSAPTEAQLIAAGAKPLVEPDPTHNDVTQYRTHAGYAIEGDNVVVQFTVSYWPDNAIFSRMRKKRNDLLADSDKTQIPDYPASPEERAEWATYRQALRDLPDTYAENPRDVIFPTPPV